MAFDPCAPSVALGTLKSKKFTLKLIESNVSEICGLSESKFCPVCRARLAADAKVCNECSTPLNIELSEVPHRRQRRWMKLCGSIRARRRKKTFGDARS